MVEKKLKPLTGVIKQYSVVHTEKMAKVLSSKQSQINVDDTQIELAQDDDNVTSKADIKQQIADEQGIAVTSEENAIELERKATDAVEKNKSKSDVLDDVNDEMQEQQLKIQREVKASIEANMKSQNESLLSQIEAEIEEEKQRAKVLYALENSRKNAIDAARATYGKKADIKSIQAAYDGMANNIDPKADDMSSLISLSLDNKLHGKNMVRMLMPNGSVRAMRSDVAIALSDKPTKTSSIMKALNENASDELDSLQSKFSKEELTKLYELEDMMLENQRIQASFAVKDPHSGPVYENEKSEREKKLLKLGLPSVGMDYDYVYYLDEMDEHDGRPLPSAMSSLTMQQDMIMSGKSYGIR